ncbi:YheC/YheD family protein [Metabacillus herbersteinensis]|uniref:YheC/YheD family protein n=1 Tax=Metabacillus herbersteinensis TaxID=283816 RepID=A0ABV6GEJ2_9BACI
MDYVKIEITPTDSDIQRSIYCEMSEALRLRLEIPTSLNSLKISCGRHSVTCYLVFINEDRLALSISEDALDALQLPSIAFNIQGCLKQIKHLKLGPIFGVLTEIKNRNQQAYFGSIHDYCVELARYCHSKALLFYVFSLSTYNKDEMMGYFFTEEEQWEKFRVPYPDVVHNRIHSRVTERSKAFSDVTSDFIEEKVPYFNDRFLNKWEIHQILLANEHLHPYLPDSERLHSKTQLENFLQIKEDIFIKPLHGSQGKRIFRVIKEADSYKLDYTTFSGNLEKHFKTFHDLFLTLYPRVKKEGFLVQETIPLQPYKNRPMDFRFLCHKKNFYSWKVSSSIARVSGVDQFVANLARGGELQKIKEVLTDLYGTDKGRHIQKLLAELSIEIVNVICLHAGGEFGEFGIDLALDENGQPWIIEVNTKPSKSDEDRQEKTTRPSARAVIDYCEFLARINEL